MNIPFFTLAITTSNMIMNLPGSMEIDIDNFNIGNVDNYNNVREHIMSSNKTASKMISISSSEVSVDYTTRIECLNNVLDDKETRKPIDSS